MPLTKLEEEALKTEIAQLEKETVTVANNLLQARSWIHTLKEKLEGKPLPKQPAAVVLQDGKSYSLGQTTGTDGVNNIHIADLAADRVRAFTPSGLGAAVNSSRLTRIVAGDVKKKVPAELSHLGIPISELVASPVAQLGLSRSQHLAVSFLDSAREARNKHFDTKFHYGMASIERTKQFNAQLAAETIKLGESDEMAGVRRKLLDAAARIQPGQDPMISLQKLTAVMATEQPMKLNNPTDQETAFVRTVATMPVLIALVNARTNQGTFYQAADSFKFPTAEMVGNDPEHFDMNALFLRMLLDNKSMPQEEQDAYVNKFKSVMDSLYLLHEEHEQNAGTQAAQNVHSTDTKVWGFLTSAIEALHGERHGGANVKVLENLNRVKLFEPEEFNNISGPDEIKTLVEKMPADELQKRQQAAAQLTPEKAKAIANSYLDMYVRYREAGGDELIDGIGHRVYKNNDPRSKELKDKFKDILGERAEKDPMLMLAVAVADRVNNDKYFTDRGLALNVDFYSGIFMDNMDIKNNLFTCIFALARTVGWMSHCIENIVVGKKTPHGHDGAADNIWRPFQIDKTKPTSLTDSIFNSEVEASGLEEDEFVERVAAMMEGSPSPTNLSKGDIVQALISQQQAVRAA